jgi:hypothetical protein
MSNGHIADFDAKILAELDELGYGLLVDLDHKVCFWPPGELVDGDV